MEKKGIKKRFNRKISKKHINLIFQNKNNKTRTNIKKFGFVKKKLVTNFKLPTLFIFSLFIIIDIYQNNSSSIFNRPKDNNIIEVNYYKKFENIKQRYIKEPILKPYLEQITILKHLYNNNYHNIIKKRGNVHICVSLNNRYVYSILVSIESALYNCNKKKTYLTYHILCASDVSEDTLTILKSLVYQYPSNLEIIFYNMGNCFLEVFSERFSHATYYRIISPIIFDIDRVIYLDGDTFIFKDLNEMYNLNFNDNYVLGILDFFSGGVDYLGIKSEKYINAGVIMLNLEKIRNDNKIYNLINEIKNKTALRGQDQSLINYVFYPKIGILPYKYVIFNHLDESDAKFYMNILRTQINLTELVNAINDPTIVHTSICWPKVWSKDTRMQSWFSACKQRNNCSCEKFHNLWYYYANKTKYYKEILKFYGKKNN